MDSGGFYLPRAAALLAACLTQLIDLQVSATYGESPIIIG